MRKLIIVLALFASGNILLAQNDIQFSHYMFNEVTFNPAATGNTENFDVSLLARQQWLGFDNSPSTQFLNGHTLFKKANSGLGFSVINDKLGFENSLNFKVMYAYHIRLAEKSHLAFGAGLGFINRSINGSQLIYEEMDDLYALKTDRTDLVPDFDFGTELNIKKLRIGISATHIQQSEESSTIKVPRHFYAYGKYTIDINEKIAVIPSVRVKSTQYITQFDAGALFQYNNVFWAGFSYRLNDAYVGLVGFNLTKFLKFGYSYDMDATDIKSYSSGSHEIFLSYSFKSFNKVPVSIKSPRLFN